MRADVIRTARLIGGMALAFCLSACTTGSQNGGPIEGLRQMERFNEAAREIGNTYVATDAHPMHACRMPENSSCVDRHAGGFTIDNSASLADRPLIIVHLVFDDGQAVWMEYDNFVMQKFTTPTETRLRFKIDETSDQIRAEWGAPAEIKPKSAHGITLQEWTYANVGSVDFKDDKIIEVALTKSLLTAR